MVLSQESGNYGGDISKGELTPGGPNCVVNVPPGQSPRFLIRIFFKNDYLPV